MNYVDEMIAQALNADIEAETSEYSNLPRHIFSLRFRRKMRKVIYAGGVPYQRTERVPLRKSIAIAFVVIILMTFVTGATKMIYKLWKNYRFHENGDYTCIALIYTKATPHKDHFLDFAHVLLASFPSYCTIRPSKATALRRPRCTI